MQAPPSSSKDKSIMPSSSVAASLFPMEAEGGVKIPWQMIEINGGAGSVGDGAWWRRRGRKGGKNDNNKSGGDGTIKKKRKPSNIIDPPKGKPICEICHKEFSGWKAAFGHMRAHPNRGYRGFFKPPDFSSSSSSQQVPTQHHQTQAQLGEASRDPRDRGFDLNQLPMEEDEENNKNQHDFDLNKLPIDKP